MPTTKPIPVRLTPDLLVKIDQARGTTPRSVWIRTAVEDRLIDDEPEVDQRDRGHRAPKRGARVDGPPAADAQPEQAAKRSEPPAPRIPPEQALCEHRTPDGKPAWQILPYMTRCTLCGVRK